MTLIEVMVSVGNLLAVSKQICCCFHSKVSLYSYKISCFYYTFSQLDFILLPKSLCNNSTVTV